jgi:hypothetical protein
MLHLHTYGPSCFGGCFTTPPIALSRLAQDCDATITMAGPSASFMKRRW